MNEQAGTSSSDKLDGGSSNWAAEGRAVEAGRGFAWIGEGWALFTKNPGIWIAQIIVLSIILVVLTMIPIVRLLALNLLMPVFMAGFYAGCHSLKQGGTLEFETMFAGFKQKTGELVLIGLFLLVGSFIIVALAFLIMGGGAMTGMIMGNSPGAGVALGSMLLGGLVAAALSVPLVMASWFAPMLVFFHNVAPLNALKQSFSASLKNVVPFLLFGIVAMGLTLIAIVPFGLGLLVVWPMLIGAAYASFCDIFE